MALSSIAQRRRLEDITHEAVDIGGMAMRCSPPGKHLVHGWDKGLEFQKNPRNLNLRDGNRRLLRGLPSTASGAHTSGNTAHPIAAVSEAEIS